MSIYCLNCNKETKNNKFCSRTCSAKYNNNTQHWRRKLGIIKKINKCLNCDKETTNEKYCNHNCHNIFERKKRIIDETASPRILKKYLIETYGNKCWTCNITSWNNKKIVLELEHIDGNSENNDLKNLSIICPNCHSQTPTYKSRNIGNGRHYRRVRYAQGTSF